MEADQLRELATNAQLDHWPPHLGVRTEAEKIEYLAWHLEETANRAEDLESQMLTFEAGREARFELAIKAPGVIPETEAETALREQSKQRYFQVNYDGVYSSYDAGWKAAKAYYENQQ